MRGRADPWLILGLVFSVAAVLVGYRFVAPETQHDGHVGQSSETAERTPTARSGLAATESKVTVAARWESAENADSRATADVTLNIDPGWHVNANPASLDFLIPTNVTAHANGKPVEVDADYPPGRASGIRLDNTEIEVYDSGTVITLTLPAAARKQLDSARAIDIVVRAQSCSDDGVCLAPSDLRTTLSLDGS